MYEGPFGRVSRKAGMTQKARPERTTVVGSAGGTTRQGLFALIGRPNGGSFLRITGLPLRIRIPSDIATVSPGRPITRLMSSSFSAGWRKTTTSPRLGKWERTRPLNAGNPNGKLYRE